MLVSPRRYLNKRLICLFSLLLWLWPAVGAELNSDAILWRVAQEDTHRGYLFGTIHSDDPRVMLLPDKVQRAFDDSDALALEMQVTPDVMSAVMKQMMRPDDSTLRETIGPEQFKQVVSALAKHGIGEAVADRLKTWAAMLTLMMPPNRSGTFLDMKLQQEAGAADMAVHSLETPREQMGIFEGLSTGEQKRLLEVALDLQPELEEMFEQITRAYLEEDLSKIQELSRHGYTPDDKPLYDKMMNLLLDKRNRTMVDNMQPLLKQGDVFVAVGAMHLPGENGIVNLLRQEGYRVEPVNIPKARD